MGQEVLTAMDPPLLLLANFPLLPLKTDRQEIVLFQKSELMKCVVCPRILSLLVIINFVHHSRAQTPFKIFRGTEYEYKAKAKGSNQSLP